MRVGFCGGFGYDRYNVSTIEYAGDVFDGVLYIIFMLLIDETEQEQHQTLEAALILEVEPGELMEVEQYPGDLQYHPFYAVCSDGV